MLTEVTKNIKFTDSSGAPYYISDIIYDRCLLLVDKKTIDCKINRVSDNKYMGKWSRTSVLTNLNKKIWILLNDMEGIKFYEKGYPDIIITLKKHANDSKITLVWDKVDENDAGESSMMKIVVEGFFQSGKWIKVN